MEIEYYEPCESRADFHATYSIQLCELIHDGLIDFSDESWNFDSYKKTILVDGKEVIDETDTEQRDRLWMKFEKRFYWREIGIRNYKRWKWELLRKLNEIMPKYKVAYKALDDGISPLQNYSEYGKSRNVFSEFPQTRLAGSNQDYATNGTDKEYEHIYLGNWFDMMKQLQDYNDVDVMILKELESFFSALHSQNVNGY